jgi:hypothetical protein
MVAEILPGWEVKPQFGGVPDDYKLEIAIRH